MSAIPGVPPAAVPALDAPPLRRYGLVPVVEYGVQPAAGAMFSRTIPGQYFERLLTVFFRLVTDANVAERQVAIEYRDSAARRFAFAAPVTTQGESTTTDYAFQAFLGQSDWEADGTVMVTLPPLILSPGHDWRIFVGAIEATDQLSAIRFVVERFLTGPA